MDRPELPHILVTHVVEQRVVDRKFNIKGGTACGEGFSDGSVWDGSAQHIPVETLGLQVHGRRLPIDWLYRILLMSGSKTQSSGDGCSG